jgi:DNA-binding winged helix-turn-helix (wHTH) protein/tetratricopeptide (TPR) repeat protein
VDSAGIWIRQMTVQPNLCFGSFVLDRANQQLCCDSKDIPLPPKTFAVLQYLAENPQRLVTQDELLKAVWGPVAVGDGLLRGYVRDIRHALADDAARPRYIETIPRRGFRFVADVTVDSTSRLALQAEQDGSTTPPLRLVGRDSDLTALHRSLQTMLRGRRQLVFIVGEAGIGKTALLNGFLAQVRATHPVLVACGQCIEQYGTREAYLPIFDALGTLCRGAHAREVVGALTRHAPSWLAQMPGVLADEQFQTLQKTIQGTTQSRMLRELCEALEALAVDRPIILTLEDLQWSDHSTLDLLSMIGRRQESGRLMLIGSYRPADVIVSGHPLKSVAQDLQAHRLCSELWPDYLSETALTEYLADRFPDHIFPPRLCQVIHRNTGGNPLFVTAIVDDLLKDQSIEKQSGRWQLKGEPEEISTWKSGSLRQAIEGQLARLSAAEQRIVEAAALAGVEFTADMVAATLETDVAEVEDHCDELVRRRQILRSAAGGASPNIAGSSRYTFSHDLYRAVALDRSPPNRRRRRYQRIADKMVADCGERVDEVATEVAYYFEQANLPLEAAHYCALAGDRAVRRFANSEAIAHFRRGIDLIRKAPASERHDALELRLQVGLALPLTATQGYGTAEVAAVISRARDLDQKLGDGPQTFGALRGLYQLLMGRGDYQATLDLCDRLDRVAEREREPVFAAEVLRMRGISAFFLSRLSDASDALKRSLLALNRRERSNSQTSAIAEDPETSAKSVLALVLWMLGYPDQARQLGDEAVTTARTLAVPYSMAIAHCFLALLMRYLRDAAATLDQADSAIAICDAHGFALWRAQASLERGWAVAMQGRVAVGIKEIQAALAPFATVGATGSIGKLVDVCLHAKKTQEGVRAVDEALRLVRDNGERTWEAELYRLKGELLVQRASAKATKSKRQERDITEAELCFATAIARARESGSKSFELRAAMSLYRLSSRKDKRNEARRILAEVYDWFTEGFSTRDLTDARQLLHNR